MHGSFEKRPREGQSAYRNWNMKLIAFPILGVVAMIAFVVSHPEASRWILDAVQAEFAGTEFVPDLTQPNNPIRTVKAY